MTTLTAFLDLAVCPVSFDSVIFIAQAEAERKKVGADRLHVCLFGEIRKKPQYDEAEAEWRLWNIVVPAVHLFGGTISVTPGRSWHRAYGEMIPGDYFWPPRWEFQQHDMTMGTRRHLVGGLIKRHAAGEKIPMPKASAHARRKVAERWAHRRLVTMTRRRTYLPERNSLDEEWQAAAAYIEARGFTVLPINDTDVALAAGVGFAELNLDLRMALYEAASFNVVANCGPASLLWLSDRPYAMTDAAAIPEEWGGLFVEQGLPIGANWPWALPHQTLLYGRSGSKEIIEAFDAWASATN